MQDALVLTVLGMGTVLIVLFIISLMIRLSGKIVGSNKQAPKAAAPAAVKAAPAAVPAAAAPAAPAAAAGDDKTIAVIAAAVAAYLGTSPANLIVRPVSVSNNWSYVGRIENTRSI